MSELPIKSFADSCGIGMVSGFAGYMYDRGSERLMQRTESLRRCRTRCAVLASLNGAQEARLGVRMLECGWELIAKDLVNPNTRSNLYVYMLRMK